LGLNKGLTKMTQDYNNYTYISTCAVAGLATQVMTGAGVLKGIFIPPALVTNYTVGIIDNTSGSTVNLANITSSTTNQVNALLNCAVGKGIRVITTGGVHQTVSVTVVWRQ
jgi:hypothetical protein